VLFRWLDGAPRLCAAVIVLCALGLLLMGGRRGGDEVATDSDAGLAGLRDDAWAVHTGGWHIEVDGVVVDPDAGEEFDESELEVRLGPDFGGYAPLIGKYSEVAGIDWRLVAALIFEESRFRPDVVSTAGAFGLMQVREIAARQVGLVAFRDPESNIRAGVTYLRHMAEEFAPARGRNLDALTLAAYNMGPGHVLDAQSLAVELGFNPSRWDGSMDGVIHLLELPQFFERTQHGFAQGAEVVAYVNRILSRYAAYRRRHPSVPPGVDLAIR
jgi:hypothetical protein